jgi:hypothetical protein
MAISIDLRRAHASYKFGDLTIVLSWLNDERAMFFVPHVRKGAPWFVIREPSAFEWSDQDPDNRIYLMDRAAKACDVLGIEPNQRNCFRIITIVNNLMQELVRMPSVQPPEQHKASLGTFRIMAGDELVHEDDIRLDKVTGIQYE